jgi:transcriptional regulator with XRE-family HTH domain
VSPMSLTDDVHEFLAGRRARVTPEMVGLPTGGGFRRVPGLRREEVAMLAGVSVDYYNRLERGNIAGASDAVLESLATALRLDDAERQHLLDLARAANQGPVPRRRRSTTRLRPGVQQLLDGMTGIPAFVRNGRLDILAMNDLARELYYGEGDSPAPTNFARYLFLDPSAPEETADWETMAADTVAILRQESGRDPHNRDLSLLIGDLSTQSAVFRTMWAAHEVRFHRNGVKHFTHPAVGEFDLSFEAMELPGQDGLTLVAYSAPRGTRSHDALALLTSLIATRQLSRAES